MFPPLSEGSTCSLNLVLLFQSAFKQFLVLFINVLHAGVIVDSLKVKCSGAFLGFSITYFIFMFLTAGHPSTPFWYFAVLASSSHPPAHNLLCTHQIGMVSVRHRDRDR